MKAYFLGKIRKKKSISLSASEFYQRVIKVKDCLYIDVQDLETQLLPGNVSEKYQLIGKQCKP